MTQEREASGIDCQELAALANEIAGAAIRAEEALAVTDFQEFEETFAALLATRERVAYMGWIADRITAKLGGIQARGDADEWLLPPSARPSELAKERAAIE